MSHIYHVSKIKKSKILRVIQEMKCETSSLAGEKAKITTLGNSLVFIQ